MTMKNNVLLASCGLLAVTLVACGGESGGSPTQSNSEGFQNGYNSFENTLTDSRDGQVYRTVTIGEQTWMAENLNYEYKINGKVYGNYCHFEGCSPYGRYYTWAAAMDSAGINGSYDGKECGLGKICGPKSPVQGICPKGWHLPSEAEWETLYREGVRGNALSLSAVGVDGDGDIYRAEAQGYNKWLAYPDTSNLASGFSALPAGHYHADWFVDVGSSACFWSADEYNEEDAKYFYIFRGLEGTVSESFDRERGDLGGKSRGLSVRCLKDDEPLPSESKLDSSESNSNVKNGVLNDVRDGKTYKTVKIGDQVWMAENLNYEVEGSSCYDDNPANCSKYGSLYTWDEAMIACPPSWHLPDSLEWRILVSSVGGDWETAGEKLKSPNSWAEEENDNVYGFSALPAGVRIANERYEYAYMGKSTSFWSSTKLITQVLSVTIRGDNDSRLDFGSTYTMVMKSVRCLQD